MQFLYHSFEPKWLLSSRLPEGPGARRGDGNEGGAGMRPEAAQAHGCARQWFGDGCGVWIVGWGGEGGWRVV